MDLAAFKKTLESEATQKVAELEKENAELRRRAAALEARVTLLMEQRAENEEYMRNVRMATKLLTGERKVVSGFVDGYFTIIPD